MKPGPEINSGNFFPLIAGVGELPQGAIGNCSTMELHARLANLALGDAGIELSDVDAILTVAPRSDGYLIHAAALAEYLDIRPSVAWTMEAGGAAPEAMLAMANALISSGTAKAVLVVAADLPSSGVTRNNYLKTLGEIGPVHPELEKPYGATVPALFANVARAYIDLHRIPESHLAAVAVHDRGHARHHPNAHFRKPISASDHLESRMIADPLRLLDCAPVSDGGGAMIVADKSVLSASACDRAVRTVGAGFSTGHMHLSGAESLTSFRAGAALDQALQIANRTRCDIDLALVYDCYTIAMLINMEDLGLAERGKAGQAFLEGQFAPGGKLAVNTHGGLLSHGHPARAGGFGNVVEAVIQLRGEAGPRQVPVRTAMAHGMGGVFASHGVVLLEHS